MTDINHSNASIWVERFLAGETTCAEEHAIYEYFRRPDLPEALEKYREMFAWYDSLPEAAGTYDISDTLYETSNDTDCVAPETNHKKRLRLPALRRWQWAGIAAMLAVLFTVGLSLSRSGSDDSDIPDEYLAYKGSYIIRDGRKITDLRIVVPEIIREEKLVTQRLSELNTSLTEVQSEFDSSIDDLCDSSNPNVRRIVETALQY